MRKLWYALPALPIFILLTIASFFSDPWYEVWVIVGLVFLSAAALVGFIALVVLLVNIAEEKAGH